MHPTAARWYRSSHITVGLIIISNSVQTQPPPPDRITSNCKGHGQVLKTSKEPAFSCTIRCGRQSCCEERRASGRRHDPIRTESAPIHEARTLCPACSPIPLRRVRLRIREARTSQGRSGQEYPTVQLSMPGLATFQAMQHESALDWTGQRTFWWILALSKSLQFNRLGQTTLRLPRSAIFQMASWLAMPPSPSQPSSSLMTLCAVPIS